ncbi:MAG TPA: tetratricopeptide repeat protein [Pyrinomonadaceae bacterium]|jgi:tetratricopeptide (TPR) repeat protein
MEAIKSNLSFDVIIDAVSRCAEAHALERRGEYEQARLCLSSLFPARMGDEPTAEGLPLDTRAEVYLRCGAITTCLASARAIAEGQAIARRLLEYALGLFEALGNRNKESEALTAIGATYWREGNTAEADQFFERASIRADEDEFKAAALIARAILDRPVDPDRSLRYLSIAASFVHENNHYIAGTYYNTLAFTYHILGEATDSPENYQIAIIHATGACFHFEKLGHRRYLARARNVLGNLYRLTGQHAEASEHLRQALRIAESLKDRTLAGQIYDTIAQNLRDQGRIPEAEKASRNAIRLLEDSGERKPLAEAYRTLASILDL